MNENERMEQLLSQLTPGPCHVDVARLMFEAGAASAHRSPGRWAWPTLSGSLACLSLVLATLLLQRPDPLDQRPAGSASRETPIARAWETSKTKEVAPGDAAASRPLDMVPAVRNIHTISYVEQRDRALEEGVDAMAPTPEPHTMWTSAPLTPRSFRGKSSEDLPSSFYAPHEWSLGFPASTFGEIP